MALYSLTPSGTTSLQVFGIKSDGGASTTSATKLTVSKVQFDSATNEIVVTWEYRFVNPTGHNRFSCAAVNATIGSAKVSEHIPSGSWYKTYEQWSDGTLIDSGTTRIAVTLGATKSVTIGVRNLFYWGYSASNWANDSRCGHDTATFSVVIPAKPSITLSVSGKTSASRGGSTGKATVSATASAGTGASSYSYYITNNGSQGSKNAAKEATGLKNNTTYSYSASITNDFGLSNTASGTYYLTPVAPSISASVSVGVGSGTFTLSKAFDTLRKEGSTTIYYGKTESYGSSKSATGVNSVSITGLAHNTKYYYKVTTTDANNGGAHTAALSATVTGTFITTGNAPTISSHSATPSVGGATISHSISYDTNDSKSSITYAYGKSTSYGSTSPSATLTGLDHNTKYYYKITVTSTKGKTATATGSFTTKGNAPTISSAPASQVTINSARISATVSYDTNASFAKITVKYGTTASYGSTEDSTTATYADLTGLKPGTKYYYSVTVTDNKGNVSSAKTGSFTTLSAGGKMYVKTTSGWKLGEVYVKVNGVWKKASGVYVKVNGAWKEGK